MYKKGLHKVSHYIINGTKTIVLNVRIGHNKNAFEEIKRVLFLANVEFKDESYKRLNITVSNVQNEIEYVIDIIFTRYNQIKYTIPIINEYMEKIGHTIKRIPFYYIDDKCKNFFNE